MQRWNPMHHIQSNPVDPVRLTPAEVGLTKAAYSVSETLTVLSIGRTSLYELAKNGDLKPGKLGTKTLFYSSDLAELLTRLPQPALLAAARMRLPAIGKSAA